MNKPLFTALLVFLAMGTLTVGDGHAAVVEPDGDLLPLALCEEDLDLPLEDLGEWVLIQTPGGGVDPEEANSVWFTPPGFQPGDRTCREVVAGTTAPPMLQAGEEVVVSDGQQTACLAEIADRFLADPSAVYFLPVVACRYRGNSARILGFVAFRITDVSVHGASKVLVGELVELVEPGGI